MKEECVSLFVEVVRIDDEAGSYHHKGLGACTKEDSGTVWQWVCLTQSPTSYRRDVKRRNTELRVELYLVLSTA